MSEQKKYEVPAPPQATNYKIQVEVIEDGNSFYGGLTAAGNMTCTRCEAVIHDGLGDWILDSPTRYGWIQSKVTRHNREKHRDLLYVLSSEGWIRAGDLIPDPVKQINDVIDQDMRSRGTVYKPNK